MIPVEFGIPTDKSAPTTEFGVSEGIFRDLGIDLRIVPYFGGPRLAAALECGSLHFAQIGTPPTIIAVNRGAGFRIVGSAIRRKLHLYLGIGSHIENGSSLRGLRLGLLSMGSCDEWVARAMFAEHGVNADSEVTFVPVHEHYARIVDLIRDRQIDGALAIEPNISQGEAAGILRVWAAAYDPPYLPKFQWTVLAASKSLIESDPALLQKLLLGYARSAHAAVENCDAFVHFLSERFELPPSVVARSVEREVEHFELDCRIDLKGLERALTLQGEISNIDYPRIPEDLLDLRFLPKTANA